MAQSILLGGAQDTAVLGASTVTNTGPSIISGDVDVSPGTAITGFPPGTVINGSLHTNDAVAIAAHAGALAAYNQLFGETPTSNLTGINLGGITLLPGIYRFDTSAQLSGTLILNTQGDPNATFHFLIGTTLLADPASQITLLNGNSVNIFWQVGSSATIGVGSNFVGTIIADQSITLQTGATLQGRALALNGAVTLDSNTITAPTPTPTPTATPAPTASPTATPGPTASPTATSAPTATPSATPVGTATPTPLPTATPSATPGPTASPSATPGPTATPSVSPGATATPSPLPTATPPSVAASATPIPIGLLYPTDLTIIPTIDLVLTDIQIDNVIDRLTDLHHGVTIPTNKLAVVDSKEVMSDNKNVLSDGKNMINRRDDSRPRPSIVSDKRWGFFITGTGEMVDVESTGTARGSSFNTGGVTVGADYRVTDNLAIGVAFGYANTDADLNFGGSVRSNNGNASIYATYYKRGFYVDGVVTGGIGSIDTRRLTVGGVTRGDSGTSAFAGVLGTGYDFELGNFSVGPVASLRYARANLDAFHEGDAFGSLYIHGHSQDSLRSAAGLQASYRAHIGRVPVTPLIRAQWQHEYLDDNASLDASFNNQQVFELKGPRLGRNSLRLDAGLSAQVSPRVGVFAIYTTELGRENYNVQSVSGGLRVSF